MYIRQDERHGFGGARVEVLGDAGRGTASAGAEVDADGGGECVGAEFAVEEGGADLGGAAGEEDGDAGVPDEGEGVLDAGSEEGMEPGGGKRLAEVGMTRAVQLGQMWTYQGWSSISKRCRRGRKGAMLCDVPTEQTHVVRER